MSLSNCSDSTSPTASVLLKAKRFGIFSIAALTATILNPLLVKAQIAVDGSTATEVKGNAIAPVGKGTVNDGNLYHSFDKFNVPNSGVTFNTGNSSVDGTKVNNIINRVTGDTPSSILGTIESRAAFPNANLYLLNPNGVVFGVNARLDIAGSFNVTTGTSLGFDQNQKFSVDKNSLSFPSGDPKNIQFAIAQPAAIINQGNLTVDAGKNISLTAGTVINTGNLNASNGNINLAAVSGNSQVELRSPDLVLGFAVNKDVIPSNWNGAIATLPKLAELLTGQASQANQVVVKPDGTIALVANPSTSDIAVKDGMAITSGKIDVSSTTLKGGNVGIFGNQIGLVNSLIDASGTNGGTVLIGGNFQGKGIAPNALQTYVDSSSKILSNGLLVGDGGKVIVWSDRSTQFFGAIAAKGGETSGNGGFVEISGKTNLDYRGSTNALAPHGKIGTLLLDPDNITIIDSTGNAFLTDVSAFANTPTNALLNNLTINAATANVILQAKNDITFDANINITTAGVGLTAQAGNSITSDGNGNGTITTNGGNVSLIANDPAFATGTGSITLGGDITTNGGNIKLAVNNAGRLIVASTAQLKSGSGNITLESKTTTGTNSGISINGNVVGATLSTGAILIDASSTNLDAVSFGANAQVIADTGSIAINGTSATANGIRSVNGVRIQSTTGAIALTGISNGGTGDGVVLQGGNTIVVSSSGSNINISGNAGNAANSGLNLTGTALTINSGTGNLTFTSDRSKFSTTTGFGFGGSGKLTLQPFSSTSNLTIDSANAGNIFLDSSFRNAAAFSTNFTNLVIGNVSSNNAISLVNPLNINSSIAPISILTAKTLDANSKDITTNSKALTLTANQGIANLGNITTAGGNVNINSTDGNINATTSTTIKTSSIDSDGGNISITTNNGSLTLQNLNSSTTNSDTVSNAGNITLTVGGSNDISVANVIANRVSLSNGNAGNLSFAMGTGNITLTGTNIDLSANIGKGGSVVFPNPVIISAPSPIVSLSINADGTTSSGNVIFNNTLTSPTGSSLSVTTSTGNITFNSTVGLSTAPLGDLLLLTNNNTNTFANTVFANSITANQGQTVINGNIVATGTSAGISLGNFTLNGDISLVGNEIDLIGTGTSTALGNITLKPFTPSQAIAIGGTSDSGRPILDLLATDIAKFGSGGSLTIGHESGTGAIAFAGATNFARPTTVRSPVGVGNVTINNNITATGNLTVQAGDFIAITNNAQITSSGGALGVILNSDRDASNNGKISLASGSSINSNGGDIVLGGGANPLTNPAVVNVPADAGITINGTINATGGNITLNGSDVSNNSGNNVGVHISSGGQVLTNGTGNIAIVGTGGTGFSDNQGIEILGTGSLIQSANGNITLTGTTGGSTSNNDGIRITNSAIVRTTGTGNLNLTGTSNATGTNGSGILMSGATLAATGSGNITLVGTSGTGTFSNAGISLGNTTSPAGQINTSSGNISLTGNSRGTDSNNQGVLLGGNITVSANGNGNINVIGTGANGVSSNIGILLSFSSSSVNVRNGNLSLNGTGQGTGTGNDGVFLSSGVVDATGTGNITLTGAAPSGSYGINFSSGSVKPSNTIGDLRLTANEMNATGTNSIKGTGNLFIEPATATRNIIVGGVSNASDNNLEINDTLLAGIQSGFTQVFIGRTDSSGLISLGNNITFNNPVTLRSPLTTGAINTSGFNFRNITGNVTFLANQNITAGNIIASGNATSLTSTSGAIDTSSGTIDTSADGNGGSISFSSATGSRVGSLNTASKITGNAGAIAFINGDITLAGSNIDVSSNNGLASSLVFNFPVTLNTALTINAFSTSGTNGTIKFIGTLESICGCNNLTINNGSGDILFTGTVGNSTTALGAISINSTGTTTFNNTVNATSLNTNASGTTELNGNVSTTTTQIYNGAVKFAGALQLTSTDDDITFNKTVNGNQALTVNSGTGNITFGGAVGSALNVLGNLIANSTGITRFNSTVNAASLTTNTGGTTELNGNITTSGTQTFNDAVTLTNAVQLNTTNSPIAFNGLVNGTRNLTVSTGTGNVNFGSSVGNLQPLQNLVITSTGTITFTNPVIANSITSNSGTTVINGNLTANGVNGNGISLRNFIINGNISLIGDEINFLGTGNGTGNLSISPFTVSQAIAIGGIGETTNTTFDLTVSDLAALSGGTFSSLTIGNAVGTGAITLAGNTTFAQRTTIQSPVGTGSINTSNFNLANTGGSLTLLANQNITTGNITAAGNAIALNSTSGAINTSAGIIDTTATSGNSGDITFKANNSIITDQLLARTNNGNSGQILLNTTNGNISAGYISTSNNNVGNAGNVTIQSKGDITFLNSGAVTTAFKSAIQAQSVNGTSGDISLISSNGAINNAIGDLSSFASQIGNSGNITLTASGNINSFRLSSVARSGKAGDVSVKSTNGNITLIDGNGLVAIYTTSINGNSGNVTVESNGDLTIKSITTGADSGNSGNVSLISNNGSIDTSAGRISTVPNIGKAGQINIDSKNGTVKTGNLDAYTNATTASDAGNITVQAKGNITTTADINASTNVGKGGNISLISSGGLINTSAGSVNTSTVNGNAGSISFTSSTGTTIGNLNTSSSSGNAGAIAFSNGNITIAGSSINTSSVNGTAANLTFAFPVTLNNSSLTINTSSSSTSGNVTFASNLNGTSAGANNLTISAGAGNITFSGTVGTNLVPLGILNVNSTGATKFSSTVNTASLITDLGGTTQLNANVTTTGDQTFNDNLQVPTNITLNSASGNGNITFNGAIANNTTGTPSNLTLNSGTGDIQINQGAGSSGDRFGNITVTNAGNFSTGAGLSIFANTFTQSAGTGRTSFGGNLDNFSGDLIVTTNNFSVTEGATLQAGNINITALGNTTSLNGFLGSPSSRLEVTGAGNITINADSNSDGIGTFVSRGVITDGGLGKNVNIRAANLNITGNITAAQILLTPSTNAPTIAIGSAATGDFQLLDPAIGFLKATNLISIAANNGNVNIGSTQAFNPGASLEIGTTTSPANIITSTSGSVLKVDKNLSVVGAAIALGNTTVGGDLAVRGNNITFGNTTANNLTIRLSNQASQTGTVNVVGQTSFIIDTNPLTNLLLADFANNFGSAITLSFANLSTTSFNNLEFRTVNVGAQFNVAPQKINNFKLVLDNGTIALPSLPLTGSLSLSAKTVSLVGNITATSASLTSLNGGNVTINNNITTTAGDLAIANSGLLTVKSGVQLDLQGALVQSGTGAVQFGGNIGNSTSVSFAQPITLIGNSTINSSGNVTFTGSVNGAKSLTVNTGGITLFNQAIGDITPLTDITTDSAGRTQINGNVTTSGSQNFNDRLLIGADTTLNSSSGQGNISLGVIANAIAGAPSNLTLNAGKGNIIFSQVGSAGDPFGNITISNAGSLSSGSLNIAGDLSFTANTIAFGNTTVAGNFAIAPTTKVTQTGAISVSGLTSFILNQSSPDILLADFENNSFNGGISFPTTGSALTVGNFELLNIATGAVLNTFPTSANNVRLVFSNGAIAMPSVALTGNLALSAKDISVNGAITAIRASLSGGNITINNNVSTTSGDLAIANSGTFRLNSNANLDLNGRLVFLRSGGTTEIGGNIQKSDSVTFVQPVFLVGNTNIITGGNITFNNSVNGEFALNLDTNGNFANFNGTVGNTVPLASLTIASNTTLSSRSTFGTTAASFAPINISTTGNIGIGSVSNLGQDVTLSSKSGSITVSNITTENTTSQGGNVTLLANSHITTGDINTAGYSTGTAAIGQGGDVKLTSQTGQISTGNITTTGQTGGQIFLDASQAINVGILNSSGSTRAGDITLDPVGDVVVKAIDASSTTQGGNVTLVSTGGNLRITDTLLGSIASSCIGASICTSGGTGGNISLQTGGLNPFLVDDATLNGAKGVLTTGATTVNLGTSIPVILSSSFIQGGIKVTPGGIITQNLVLTDPKQPFIAPQISDNIPIVTPSDNEKSPINVPASILKQEAARYLQSGNFGKAFDSLERAYGSELQVFMGRPLNLSSITIEESQDVLTKTSQRTGDVAALVYPLLIDNRIEIMVIPPKDKGVPFRRFTIVPSQENVEGVLTDYRNNIRDVGSNDYLEQSQKLYDWIMRPIDSQLKAMKINTLVFVMDAGLRVIPPAAMHDGKQFVVERYGIASVASMRVTRIEERDRKATRVLAMGLTDSVSGFSALPSVDVEIKTIASNVLEGSAFLNKDFTVNNLQAQRQLGKYNILHLGTHGKFVSDTSGESFIQFWDSRLSLSEIPKLRFDNPPIDMLTLSACQTAVGNNLGISGLAVESGAKSVLASLWEVSDAGTAPLMISFYKSFPNAINKAQAMQQAQISLLSGKVSIKNGQITGILGVPNISLPSAGNEIDLSHPFYWSSFILVGNWL